MEMTTKQGELLPECVRIFERLETKLDHLVERADAMNGHNETHMAITNSHSTSIALQQESITSLRGSKILTLTTLLTLIVSVVLAAVTWGQALKQIEVNTRRLDKVENTNSK